MRRNLFILLIIAPIIGFSQPMRTGIEYKYNIDKLIKSDSITWFGWDFTHFLMNDYHCDDGQYLIDKFIPGCLQILDKEKFGDSMFKKILKKNQFKYDQSTLQSKIQYVNPKYLVDIYRIPITIDSISGIVKAYPTNGEGIAGVIILCEMKKADQSVNGFFTFYDQQSKELLYVVQIKGKAGDKYGMVRYYRNGMKNMVKIFSKYYKKLK